MKETCAPQWLQSARPCTFLAAGNFFFKPAFFFFNFKAFLFIGQKASNYYNIVPMFAFNFF